MLSVKNTNNFQLFIFNSYIIIQIYILFLLFQPSKVLNFRIVNLIQEFQFDRILCFLAAEYLKILIKFSKIYLFKNRPWMWPWMAMPMDIILPAHACLLLLSNFDWVVGPLTHLKFFEWDDLGFLFFCLKDLPDQQYACVYSKSKVQEVCRLLIVAAVTTKQCL